jgi:hypothetical protein
VLVRRWFAIGRHPVTSGELPIGLSWVARQAALRDDARHFGAGLARYAALRGLELAGLGERLAPLVR